MSKRQKSKERLTFDYDLYHKVAVGIHDAFCENTQWCNYGDPVPVELEDDKSIPTEARQERTSKRLEWMHHCDIAVSAENIAARIQFGKGAKVRKFPKTALVKENPDDSQGSPG